MVHVHSMHLSLPIPSLSRTHYMYTHTTAHPLFLAHIICTHTQLHTTDPNFNHADSQQKEYIAWQSRFIYLINNTKLTAFFISAWDLLRVDVYGFKQFCEYFFKAHPYNFVSPLRVSGSAVETLFSQYKYAAGWKLDSNYATVARVTEMPPYTPKHPH